MNASQSDERYEVLVKHYSIGVLHMISFKTFNQAREFVDDQWRALSERGEALYENYGAAVFDKDRIRVLTRGAAYLTDERSRR
jgi:hypothetical protein